MDKLRALEYLIAAAEERSFSAAARRLGVSQPAVQKLVTALEAQLGVVLFERRSSGLAITGEGAAYAAHCRGVLEALRQAEEDLASREQPRGLVVVGTTSALSLDYLGPELPIFHRRFPEVRLEIRELQRLNDPAAEGADVFIFHGWQEQPDLIRVPIGATKYVVAASPAYWERHGMPERPSDLSRHVALLYRSGGTVLDCWRFQREGEQEIVNMNGWLYTSHRQLLVRGALAGVGVARLIVPPRLSEGLVAALTEWNALEAPPLQVLVREQHRDTVRVRCFAEFAVDALRRFMSDDATLQKSDPRPKWWDRHRNSSGSKGRRP